MGVDGYILGVYGVIWVQIGCRWGVDEVQTGCRWGVDGV